MKKSDVKNYKKYPGITILLEDETAEPVDCALLQCGDIDEARLLFENIKDYITSLVKVKKDVYGDFTFID